MKRFLVGWGAVLLAYQLPLSAETPTVQVSGIKDPGEIHIAIYDNAEAFEGDKGEKGGPAEGIVDGVVEEAEPGSVTYTFELPQGRYAIGVFHDANRNNRLDTGLFGIPKEQFGFSNGASGRFGPPSFADASFELVGEANQMIDLGQ